MEMKKFILSLLAAIGIMASAIAYADTTTVNKADVPSIDSGDTVSWGKCPPFC